MTGLHCKLLLTRSILVSALVLLASCGTLSAPPVSASKTGDVEEAPLLVQFTAGCPTNVITVVEDCVAPPQIPPPTDTVVCRQKGKKVVWLAVAGSSPPYLVDPGHPLPDFKIEPEQSNHDPIEKPGGGAGCKDSRNGVLECKIRTNAHLFYKYSVVVAGCTPPLDPRIYVP
jgi:hypothetical protein